MEMIIMEMMIMEMMIMEMMIMEMMIMEMMIMEMIIMEMIYHGNDLSWMNDLQLYKKKLLQKFFLDSMETKIHLNYLLFELL